MNNINPDYRVTALDKKDKSKVASFISERWGSTISVSRGKVHDTTELPGFICEAKGKVTGLITYHISGDDCEIVTLDSIQRNSGLGTSLLNRVIQKAREKNCKRVWLITTNDNTKAIRFYQKRGFEMVGFYRNAMEESRKLKPEIPLTGEDDIPIKHEIEFEYRLDY